MWMWMFREPRGPRAAHLLQSDVFELHHFVLVHRVDCRRFNFVFFGGQLVCELVVFKLCNRCLVCEVLERALRRTHVLYREVPSEVKCRAKRGAFLTKHESKSGFNVR